ncbi:hypothetical protein [Pararhizobium polonicum]|uniref:hypothetical protein n=1 Tax=Pararhizobium polonicum TaxID=1612624 RepID=UPI0013149FEF|nr:hypothetical protein [Pararhizobium polonicum]
MSNCSNKLILRNTEEYLSRQLGDREMLEHGQSIRPGDKVSAFPTARTSSRARSGGVNFTGNWPVIKVNPAGRRQPTCPVR